MSVSDRLAIQDVLASYAAGVDERDRELYRSCFSDDVELIGFSDGVIIGADKWVETVWQILERFGATQHLLGPVRATVNGDSATARTDVQAMHNLVEPAGAIYTLWATYLTGFSRIDGVWKIARHELVRRGSRTDKPD